MDLVLPILLLPIMLATLVALPLIGRAILGPINRAAGYLKAPHRFQLSDFVWLLVQLQIVLAACVQFVGVDVRGLFEALLAFGTFAVVGMWAGAVSFLSRAGLTHPWRRATFILLVLPGTLAIMIATPFLLAMICLAPLGYARELWEGYRRFSWLTMSGGIALACLAVAATLAVGWCLRKLSHWVAAGAEVFAAESVPESR